MKEPLSDKARLNHICDSVRLIAQFVEGATFDDFMNNSMMFSACVRHIEIIGEAAVHVSIKLRDENPEVPWSKMIGMRNILIHNYFGMDEKVIWGVIQQYLPDLESQIQTILQKFD